MRRIPLVPLLAILTTTAGSALALEANTPDTPASGYTHQAPAAEWPSVNVPETLPQEGASLELTLGALARGQHAVAVSGLVLLVLLVIRKVGALVWPALGTDIGGTVLAALAGAAATVVEMMSNTPNPTAGLVVVAAASGLWAWARKLGLLPWLVRILGLVPSAPAPLPAASPPPPSGPLA